MCSITAFDSYFLVLFLAIFGEVIFKPSNTRQILDDYDFDSPVSNWYGNQLSSTRDFAQEIELPDEFFDTLPEETQQVFFGLNVNWLNTLTITIHNMYRNHTVTQNCCQLIRQRAKY